VGEKAADMAAFLFWMMRNPPDWIIPVGYDGVMHVVIFEGSHWGTFAPLSLSRPVFTLATGMSTLLAKQVRHLEPSRLTLWVRPEFEEFCRKRVIPQLKMDVQVNVPLDDEPALVVSGRTLHLSKYEYPHQDAVNVDERQVVHSAQVRSPGLEPADVVNRSDKWLSLLELPRMMPQSRMVESLWDLIAWNEESLIEDSMRLRDCTPPGGGGPKLEGPFHIINEADVCLMGKEVDLQPGVVLDASRGPVVLGEKASIGANSVIQGPCYIAEYAEIRPLTVIRPGTSIGPLSRVGGEVSNSIILGYSNKAHDGYLGDSYVGKWANLGAGTTTSNVKNTYGEIKGNIGDRQIPTGRRKLGCVIGDHSKLGIGTRTMAGSYIGFCCQLAGSTIAPRSVPSYSYWTDKGMQPYELEKAIEVTKRVFTRRDRQWTDIDEEIVRYAARMAPQVETAADAGIPKSKNL
jgi:UDP-N-acetylglucosamine diphosphorylase / glucose-1-phosphate thymidylyltransferase / UDP-N-acetylgalactosamine diphosphorylase / glucosamine-1-phosphate N-acetyltransferase / galactosamine-1-phosphate N-acetyltransferase